MQTMPEQGGADATSKLASYRRCAQRIGQRWPAFTDRRRHRLRQGLFGSPVEKIAENILEDLFTDVLDWSLDGVNLQIGRADVVLSDLGIKRLVLEVKRPGSLQWNRPAVQAALDQARRYAAEQTVGAVAVSDGTMLYAADVTDGGLRDRLLVSLDAADPPVDLWWVSMHGIYRPPTAGAVGLQLAPEPVSSPMAAAGGEGLVHPKYRLPAHCFAYVGAADDVRTWKLPFLQVGGAPDATRLPKAMQAILSNYRGAKVSIPRDAVGDVLVRLAGAARRLHKLPCQCADPSAAYVEAHLALVQLGRLADVGCCS